MYFRRCRYRYVRIPPRTIKTRAPNAMPIPRPIWADLESEEEEAEEEDEVLAERSLLLIVGGIKLEEKDVTMDEEYPVDGLEREEVTGAFRFGVKEVLSFDIPSDMEMALEGKLVVTNTEVTPITRVGGAVVMGTVINGRTLASGRAVEVTRITTGEPLPE